MYSSTGLQVPVLSASKILSVVGQRKYNLYLLLVLDCIVQFVDLVELFKEPVFV